VLEKQCLLLLYKNVGVEKFVENGWIAKDTDGNILTIVNSNGLVIFDWCMFGNRKFVIEYQLLENFHLDKQNNVGWVERLNL